MLMAGPLIPKRMTFHQCDLPPKTPNYGLVQRKTSDKPKLRDIL